MEFSVGFFKLLYLISLVFVIALTISYFNQVFHMVTSIFLRKKTWPDAARQHSYACIIAAHNEEAVIGDLIDSILRQDYPQELLHIFVVADNCSDRTAEIARSRGVHVLVRDNPLERGKSYALDYAFKTILSMNPALVAEGYFIFDADNYLTPDYIAQMNKAFDSGEEIVAGYRDSKNFSVNWVSGVNSYMFLRESRQIHFSRSALGIGTFVSGTGFLIAEHFIREAGGWPYRTLTEDIELSTDYTIRGGKVAYCADAVFYDEQPCSLRDSFRQRLRWCKGIHQIFARRGMDMIISFLRRPSLTKWGILVHIIPLPAIAFLWFIISPLIGAVYAAICSVPMDVYTSECLNIGVGSFVYPYAAGLIDGFILMLQCYGRLNADRWKKWWYMFLFPLGMYLFVPATIAALFLRVEWKPIRHYRYIVPILLFGLFSLPLRAQSDSLLLKEAVLVSSRNESILVPSGVNSLQIDASGLKKMPAILGSTDPLRLTRFLPSMQASTEIDAGIHIQGNDHNHNLVSSGGVPIYGANHLFGLFSTFNPSHFSGMDYATSVPEANRLGGKLDILLPEAPERKFSGEFSIGLLSAAGSVCLPAFGNGSVRASVRRSFVNLLYGSFLRFESSSLKYGFTDANITGIWQLSGKDRLWTDIYFGNDAVGVKSGNGVIGVDLPWYNAMAAVHHQRDISPSLSFHQKLYATRFALSPTISYASVRIRLPSDLSSAGYDMFWRISDFQAGASFIYHIATPQQLNLEGSYFGKVDNPATQHGQEAFLFARYSRRFDHLDLDGSLKGTLWHGPDGKWMPEAGGVLSLGWNFGRAGRVQLRGDVCCQHLIQCGFTGIGLPFEFWMLPGLVCGPQGSVGASLQHRVSFLNDSFTLTSELYYKKLTNQVEYLGGIMDLISRPYSLKESLSSGDGRTFGLNLMLHRTKGPLTGWLSFSWGRSLRTFDKEEGEIPSSHERIFEIDLLAAYKLGKWDFTLTSQIAGGTPYTPATDLYLMSGYVMVEYGPRNSARLPVYHRTDIGVNYTLSKSPFLEHVFNFSIYNLFMAENPLYKTLKFSQTGFRYTFESLGIILMPSIGYTLHFK